MIQNSPVSEEDVKVAEKIYGKDISTLKGKSTRTKPVPKVNDVIEIPKALLRKHQNVKLCADIMYIQNMPFLTTISKNIAYRTIQWIPDKTTETLMSAFDNVFRIYNKANFVIHKMHCDPEFRHLKDVMADVDIELQLCAAQEHVPEIERSIRVIKERFRSMYHRLPYAALPRVMIKIGAMEVARWLNTFPPRNGISEFYSPRTIMSGKPIDYNKHCKTPFGAYVQALHESNPTNTNAPRTIGCIYLRYLEQGDGAYELYNLSTKKVLTRRKYTKLPIPDHVIEKVEQIARQDGIKPELLFHDRKGTILCEDGFIAGVDDDDDDNDDDNDNNDSDESDSDSTDENDTEDSSAATKENAQTATTQNRNHWKPALNAYAAIIPKEDML